MHGCCVDKKYGNGCTEETCMQLPAGKTCGDCVHIKRCKAIFGHVESDTSCDWFPRRFVLKAGDTPEVSLERVRQVAQRYAPLHGELRASDSAWFAMGMICDALGIKTGDSRVRECCVCEGEPVTSINGKWYCDSHWAAVADELDIPHDIIGFL
jgi:hypothetical protein